MSLNIGIPVSSDAIGPITYRPFPPTVTNVSIREAGPYIVGAKLYMNQYTYADLNDNPEQGSILRWYTGPTNTGPWIENLSDNISEETCITASYTVSPGDTYIRAGVTPANLTNPTQGIEVFSEPIGGGIAESPPEVTDIIVYTDNEDNAVYIGNKLRCTYKYKDNNGDPESGTRMKWYRSANQEDPWTLISESVVDQDGGGEYTLSTDDFKQYIKIGITPKNSVNPTTGVEVFKTLSLNINHPPTPPIVSNIRILKIINDAPSEDPITSLYVGDTLYIEYDYDDINGDFEGRTEFYWYKALWDDPSDTGKLVLNENGKAYTSRTYTIRPGDLDYEIFVEVKPQSL